jgi:hypothetical protein
LDLREPGSAELYAAIRRVWDFGRLTSGRRFKPGVRRYRSIEEMQDGLAGITIEQARTGK